MKICMVTPRYPPNIHGGGEISCKLLVDNLRKNGFDVDVFSADQKFSNIKNNSILNIKTYSFLKDKIRSYDIFHTYNMSLLPSVGFLTKKFNINSVATLNGIVYSPSLSTYRYKRFSPRYYRNKLMLYFILNIKYFVTLFQFFREKWIDDGLKEENISVIPNMIDASFKPVSHVDDENNSINLLHVGNYTPTRSEEIRKLIEAYSKLKKQDINLIMVGKGKIQVERLINKYRPKNKINHLGEQPYSKIPEIYSKADVFVHPSIFPKTGDRVIYEALMSGVCVITTGNNHYSEIIKNMEHGVLIYPMTAEALADNIQILIEDNKLRRMLADNGKKRIYEVCSPEMICKKYRKVYEDLIG